MDEPKIRPLSVASTGLRFPHSPAGTGEPYSKAPLPAPPSLSATGCRRHWEMGAQDPRNGSPIFDHQFLGIIHEDVDLLISDNDSISVLRQLDHEPAREKEITNSHFPDPLENELELPPMGQTKSLPSVIKTRFYSIFSLPWGHLGSQHSPKGVLGCMDLHVCI